ncbi:MAG: choice-of-anchor D domain-containing protein [Deltaproteobacteria bacterium]|nr:choice-of-anchor D domain-containing protein [Deltaproteobacteria bacterium]
MRIHTTSKPDARKTTALLTLGVSVFALAAGCRQDTISLGSDDPTDATSSAPDGAAADAATSAGDASPAPDGGVPSGDATLPAPDGSSSPGVDLTARWILVNGSCPLSLQYATPRFEASVENHGTEASSSVLVRLIACSGICTGQDVRFTLFDLTIPEGLQAGEVRPITIPALDLPASPVGMWQLFLTADPDGSVAETDENNNTSDFLGLHNGLRAQPAAIDFGTDCVGAEGQASVTLENAGNLAVTVEAIYPVAASTEVGWQTPTPPLTLAPGASQTIAARYAPVDAGRDSGMLVIDWSLSDCPLVISFAGEGLAGATQSETFQQRAAPAIDVLTVIDNSGSMIDEEATLRSNMPLVLSSLQQRSVDFHLAVTTMDLNPGGARGRLLGASPFVTPSTPNGAATWAASTAVGTAGSGLDEGLEASKLALSPPLTTGANAGFLRTDASLLVLYVSDEDDGSPLGMTAYRDFLLLLKSDPAEVRVNAAVTGPGSNCGAAAQRYLDLVAATGGRSAEICGTDWSSALVDLHRDGFGLRRRFTLNTATSPIAASLEVSVNGNVVPASAWSYDPATRAITFGSAAIPGPGATIDVRYPTRCP